MLRSNDIGEPLSVVATRHIGGYRVNPFRTTIPRLAWPKDQPDDLDMVDTGHPSLEACQPPSVATQFGCLCFAFALSRPPGTPGTAPRGECPRSICARIRGHLAPAVAQPEPSICRGFASGRARRGSACALRSAAVRPSSCARVVCAARAALRRLCGRCSRLRHRDIECLISPSRLLRLGLLVVSRQ